MQHLILALALFFTSLLCAQTKDNSKNEMGSTITITVQNTLNDLGEIRYAIYSKENFRKEPSFSKIASIENGISIVVFENVPKGIYAVICFHDENKNGRMDFYDTGIPKESYGTSNNDMSFGSPIFENSKFELKEEDLSLEIKF